MSAALRSVAVERRTPLVDAALRMPGGARNFAEFVHFTDAGADELSREVAEEIRNQVSAKDLNRPHDDHFATAIMPPRRGDSDDRTP